MNKAMVRNLHISDAKSLLTKFTNLRTMCRNERAEALMLLESERGGKGTFIVRPRAEVSEKRTGRYSYLGTNGLFDASLAECLKVPKSRMYTFMENNHLILANYDLHMLGYECENVASQCFYEYEELSVIIDLLTARVRAEQPKIKLNLANINRI